MAVSYSELLDKMAQGSSPGVPGGYTPSGGAVGIKYDPYTAYDPFANIDPTKGVMDSTNEFFSDPSQVGKWWLMGKQEEIAAQQAAAARASQSYVANYSGQKAALKKQRAAAAEMRAIQKAQYEHNLSTGLRDIEQGREKGLKGAINNALQRGIFRSGIKLDNMTEVERESDEAGSDLQQQIEDALAMLTQQGISQEAGYDAQLAGYAESERASRAAAAQQKAAFDAQSMLSMDDVSQILTQGQFAPIDLYGTSSMDPVKTPPSGGVQPVNTGGGDGAGGYQPI